MLERAPRGGCPRRVLMTGDTVGGVWNFALELARQLTRRGTEVMLATMGGLPGQDRLEEAGAIQGLTLKTSDYKLEWMEEPWEDVARSGKWTLGLAREFQPDLVHLNTFGHGGLPWNAPVVTTAHSCVLSWWRAVKQEPAPPSWNRYRAAVRQALRTADRVTAPTAAFAQTLTANYGVSGESIEVIANGRHRELFRAGEKQPFVVTAGRLWDEAKNTAAMARVSEHLPWPVYAAGAAQSPHGETACLGRANMLGSLSTAALAGWLSRAAIFALPARYEPFGLTPLEAGLSGCALVLGDIPSLHEVWGDAALYVEPDKETALRETLQLLIRDEALRKEMARRASARAASFDPEITANGYLKVYRAALSQRVPACAS